MPSRSPSSETRSVLVARTASISTIAMPNEAIAMTAIAALRILGPTAA